MQNFFNAKTQRRKDAGDSSALAGRLERSLFGEFAAPSANILARFVFALRLCVKSASE
jgi:hypothetical protein